MSYIREKNNGENDSDKIPEGTYYFTGEEGFVKVQVDKNGNQSWNIENWFASLDPDNNEEQRRKIILDIKSRINAETGIINPTKNKTKKNFLNPFKR